ncbi:hypothetical protein Droror1_Dr00025197 [Drosera rotundifolia]
MIVILDNSIHPCLNKCMRSNKKPLWRKRESVSTSVLKRFTRHASLKDHHPHPTAVRCYEPDHTCEDPKKMREEQNQVRTEIVVCHDRLTTIEFDLAIVDRQTSLLLQKKEQNSLDLGLQALQLWVPLLRSKNSYL